MTTADRRFVVLGATGNVGSVVVSLLRASGARISAVALPDDSAAPPGVDRFAGSFADAALLARAMAGAAGVFVLTPPDPRMPEWHRTIAEVAVDRGIRRIVKLSAFDTSPDSPLHMGRWHAEGEAAIAATGIDHAFVRPQYFMQMQRTALRAAVRTGTFEGTPAPEVRMGVVHVADIAAVVVALLGGEAPLAGREVVPTGPEALSWPDMARLTSAAAGREVRYRRRDPGEILADLRGRGWPQWHIDDYLAIHAEASRPLVTRDVSELTGSPARAFSRFVAEEVVGGS